MVERTWITTDGVQLSDAGPPSATPGSDSLKERNVFAVFVYECAACDARASIIESDRPPETERCISCRAESARLLCRGGEQ